MRRIIIEVDSAATAHEVAFLERELLPILKVDHLRIRIAEVAVDVPDDLNEANRAVVGLDRTVGEPYKQTQTSHPIHGSEYAK